MAARFGRDFAWGFAASAYQVEGAAAQDGRGPSIWDTFARQPGAVVNGDNGDVACDHYHRYREDVALMAELGASAYRFSISWPRVLPQGTGTVNVRGVDFYQRLVDELLAAGVQPMVNLFHWDLPQALQDRGGFANPEVVGWFSDYTALMVSRLGDRVSDWMTFNEPAVYAFLGHADGIHAPGLRNWPTAIKVADNELRAHAAAAEVIRSAIPSARVGVAIDVNQAVPATDSGRRCARCQALARNARLVVPRPAATAVDTRLTGWRRIATPATSKGWSCLRRRAGELDYIGLNYYRRETVHARSDRAFDWYDEVPAGAEVTAMGWHVAPDGLREILLELTRRYSPKKIVISENGAAYDDAVSGGWIGGRRRSTELHRTSPSGGRRRTGCRRAGQRLLRVVVHGQLRVELRLHQAVRGGSGGLRVTRPYRQAERPLVPGADRLRARWRPRGQPISAELS